MCGWKSISVQCFCLLALHCCLAAPASGSDKTALPPDSPRATSKAYLHAAECFRKGDWQGAVAALTDCLRKDPKFADGLALRAECYNRLHDFDKAIIDYCQYLTVCPAGDWPNGLAPMPIFAWDNMAKPWMIGPRIRKFIPCRAKVLKSGPMLMLC